MDNIKENLENIKSKVIEHIKEAYPPEKSESFITKINSMGEEEFIDFLKQNGLIKDENSPNQCVFCSIVKGEIPSTKIGENEKAIAILDINPASKGHTLIIPKEHISSPSQIPPEITDLTKEISLKLKKAFNPKDIQVVSANTMGHEIINLLPIYNNETINSPRTKKTPEELTQLKKEIDAANTEQIPEPKKETLPEKAGPEEISEKDFKLPRRLP